MKQVCSRNSMPPSRQQTVHKCYQRKRKKKIEKREHPSIAYYLLLNIEQCTIVTTTPPLLFKAHHSKPLSTWSKVRSKTTQRPKISSYQELPCTGPLFLLFLFSFSNVILYNFFLALALFLAILILTSGRAILTIFYMYVTLIF